MVGVFPVAKCPLWPQIAQREGGGGCQLDGCRGSGLNWRRRVLLHSIGRIHCVIGLVAVRVLRLVGEGARIGGPHTPPCHRRMVITT